MGVSFGQKRFKNLLNRYDARTYIRAQSCLMLTIETYNFPESFLQKQIIHSVH